MNFVNIFIDVKQFRFITTGVLRRLIIHSEILLLKIIRV